MTRQNIAVIAVLLMSILIPLGLQAQTQLPVPTGLTATVQNKTVRLEWQEVEGAARYRIAIHTKATGWRYMEKQSTRNYTHTNLADDILYEYSVQAIDADGVRGQWSDLVTVR